MFSRVATSFFVLAYPLEKIGAPTRIRTSDPLIKSQLLYQLSYRRLNFGKGDIVLLTGKGKWPFQDRPLFQIS